VVDGLLYTAFANDEAHTVTTAPTSMTEDHVTSQDGLARATYFGCTSTTDPITKSLTWDTASGELTAIAAVFSYATTDLTLGDHASGQASDTFVVSTPVTDVLFRFTLDPTGSVSVTQLDVNYTTTGGVVDGDIDQGALWQDDGDGVWESGEDSLIQGSVSGSGGQLSFTTDFSPPAAETVYFVRARVSSLDPDETTTFSLGTADITTDADLKTGSAGDATHAMDSVGTDLCAFNFLDNPVDITPTLNDWQDVDVSNWVPVGATGVILQAVNPDGTPRDFLVRKKVASSPDAYVDEEIEATSHAWPMVGLDANRTFQVSWSGWIPTGHFRSIRKTAPVSSSISSVIPEPGSPFLTTGLIKHREVWMPG
jgi:hypothetical protein